MADTPESGDGHGFAWNHLSFRGHFVSLLWLFGNLIISWLQTAYTESRFFQWVMVQSIMIGSPYIGQHSKHMLVSAGNKDYVQLSSWLQRPGFGLERRDLAIGQELPELGLLCNHGILSKKSQILGG